MSNRKDEVFCNPPFARLGRCGDSADAIGAYHRVSTSQPAIESRDLWDEYGLRDYESGAYENDGAKMTAAAYQLQDSTGAMAAFDWLRPATAKVSRAGDYAAETPTGLMLVRGNYPAGFRRLQAVTGRN